MTPQQLRETHQEWVDACLDNAHRLTKWEGNFLESLDEQLTNGRTLTGAQADRLESIYFNAEKT